MATIGSISFKIFFILNRFIVEIKTLTPPSGKLIFFIIRATVPTECISETWGLSTSSLSITIPIKPSLLYDSSIAFASSGEFIISGVKIPGKMGLPTSGIKNNLFERVCSTGTIV